MKDTTDINDPDYFPDDPGGVLVVPPEPGELKHDMRALMDYCEGAGRRPAELSKEELDRFVVGYF